jgi:integrase
MNEAFKLNYATKFQLEKRNANGSPIIANLPIQMVITFNGHRLKMFTGYRIDVAKFEAGAERVNPKCTNAKKETGSEINKHLVKLKTSIDKTFDHFKLQKAYPTVEDIKKAFNQAQGKSTISKVSSFFDVFDQFINQQGKENAWTVSTIKKINTVKNTVYDFDNKLTFADFDKNKLQSYLDFLRLKKKYRNATIAKQIKFIRWFLRWASENKHNVKADAIAYRPKLNKGVTVDNDKVVFFTLDELRQLRDFDPQKDYLTRVKHVFLFCAFSGIRYSDAYNLKKNDIKDDTIEITTQKTTDALIIQLNDHTRAILEIYKDVDFEGGKALPVISNQKMNMYLKELCQLAGFNEPIKNVYYIGNNRIEEVKPKHDVIGTHTARRSFISNAIALGVPVEILIKWTGHKDYKAMAPYLKVLQEKKAEEMNRFNF